MALLALLAAEHPRPLGRGKIIAILWPDSPPRRARHRLSDTLYILRGALGDGAILAQGDDLRLDPTAVTCDLWEFNAALDEGRFEDAMPLYAGPFLDGFLFGGEDEFQRWAEVERLRLTRRFQGGLEALARRCHQEGNPEGASRWWRRLVETDPLSGSAVRHLMETLQETGKRTEALRWAEQHSRLLVRELDVEPDPEIRDMVTRLRSEPSRADEGPPAPGTPMSHPPSHPERGAAPQPVDASATFPSRGWSGRGSPRVVIGASLVLVAAWAFTNGYGTPSQDHPPEFQRFAVLPLANLTGDEEEDYFVAGMHEALVSELGRIPDLTVLSRQSVLRFQGTDVPLPTIARELGVDVLVEGAVFRVGDSIRVTMQLVRAHPEEQLWAGSHQGSLDQALALQAQAARAIAGAVRARTAPEGGAPPAPLRTVDRGAQEAYLRGRFQVERSRLGTLPPGLGLEAQLAGVAHLEEAVALAPKWAAAHAQLAGAYVELAGRTEMQAQYFPRARDAALRALELDEGEAQAHAALGMVLAFHEWDWAAAERAIRRAVELDSSAHLATYASYLRAVERYDEAATYLRMAEERNPLSRSLKRQIVVARFCAGRYEEAAAAAQYVAELWPDLERAHLDYLLGHVHSARSDHARAIAAYERAVMLSDGAAWAFEGLAYGHARAGSHQAARRLLDRLEREHPDGRPAPQYVALGDVEGAVSLVEADFQDRGLRAFLDLRCFPEFSTLRQEARIQQILDLMGLPT